MALVEQGLGLAYTFEPAVKESLRTGSACSRRVETAKEWGEGGRPGERALT